MAKSVFAGLKQDFKLIDRFLVKIVNTEFHQNPSSRKPTCTMRTDRKRRTVFRSCFISVSVKTILNTVIGLCNKYNQLLNYEGNYSLTHKQQNKQMI